MSKLTRTEAEQATAKEIVKKLLSENCELTSRLLDEGERGWTEWSATIELETKDGNLQQFLSVYYMLNADETAQAGEDGANINWESKIDRFEIC